MRFYQAYTLVSKEILHRFIYFFLCFILCFVSSWIYEKELLFMYLQPLLQLNQNIMYTSISEAFYTSLRVSIWVSLACCLPYGMYQSFCFFLPSFFPFETLRFYKGGAIIVLLYCFSFVFCRVYIIPELCCWFLKYSVSTEALSLSLQAKVSNYVSWSGQLYIISLCILQIPYIFWILLELGVCIKYPPYLFFSQNRKYVIICVLLLCACCSPPDFLCEATIFFFSCIVIESILWYSFMNQALNLQKARKKKGTFGIACIAKRAKKAKKAKTAKRN